MAEDEPIDKPMPDRGAALVEYALLLALIALVCIVAVTTLGSSLSTDFDSSGDSLFGP